MDVNTCYGSSKTTLIEVGDELYYRLSPNWFGVALLSLARNNTKAVAATAADPTISGLTGFLRIAYRF